MKNIWINLTKDIRNQIKLEIIKHLASTNSEVRKGISIAIAGIAHIELPRNEWPELINILVINSKNENLTYKSASLETLNNICEDANESFFRDYEEIREIIDVFCSSTYFSNIDIQLLGIRGILFILQNCSNYIHEKTKSNIFDSILSCCIIKNEKIQLISF